MDLGHAGGHWREGAQDNLREFSAIGGHLAFALVDCKSDGDLPIDAGGEHFGGGGGYEGVAGDEFGDRAARGFNAQGEWNYIEEECAGGGPAENGGLDGRAERNDLVGV